MSFVQSFFVALQFLTRIPVPAFPFEKKSLARASKFFPVIGLAIGTATGGAYLLFALRFPAVIAASLALGFQVVVTGALHEDGLADAADGFGGGRSREKTLEIFRDSRIGTFGACALLLSILLRINGLAEVPRFLVIREVMLVGLLSRWSTLPLSYFLAPARSDGQGVRIAGLTSRATLISSSLFTLACALLLLRQTAIAPLLAACGVVLATGLYYRRRLGGVTGDCFGATSQLTELAVYLCAVWSVR